MRTFSVFLICFIFFLSCTNKSQTPNDVKTSSTLATVKDSSITFNKVKDTPVVFNKIVDSIPFLKDYKESINTDSTFLYKGKKIIVYHLLTKEGYFLPSKYVLDDNTPKNAHIMYTQTEIISDNNESIIDNNKINSYLDSDDVQIAKYGVLRLSKDDIKIIGDSLQLTYSYSIPYTDLGKQAIVSMSLDNYKTVVNVY